jgi:hypothetical protein
LPTVGRGVLTAVIAARFITSIKEPEALTFNSNAWFGGSALVPGACKPRQKPLRAGHSETEGDPG